MLYLNLYFLLICSIISIYNFCRFKGFLEINNIKGIIFMYNLEYG